MSLSGHVCGNILLLICSLFNLTTTSKIQYTIVDQPKTWNDANRYCLTEFNGTLVDLSVNDFNDTRFEQDEEEYWVGLKSRTNWVWSKDYTPIKNFHWYPGQPSDDVNENRILLWDGFSDNISDNNWRNVDSDANQVDGVPIGYICQFDYTKSQSTQQCNERLALCVKSLENWFYIGGFRENDNVTWQEATNKCKALGFNSGERWYLAQVNSAIVQNDLSARIRFLDKVRQTKRNYWIGAEVSSVMKYVMFWTSGAEYTNEFNTLKDFENSTGGCGVTYNRTLKIHHCNSTVKFICQYVPSTTETDSSKSVSLSNTSKLNFNNNVQTTAATILGKTHTGSNKEVTHFKTEKDMSTMSIVQNTVIKKQPNSSLGSGENMCNKTQIAYVIVNQTDTWDNAQQRCRRLNQGKLLYIDCEKTNEFFSPLQGQYWIGLRSHEPGKGFVWANGEPYSQFTEFTYGWKKIPDSSRSKDGCVAYVSAANWNVFNCTSKNYFICEYTSNDKENFGIFTTASTKNNNLGLSTITEKNSFTTSADDNNFGPITTTRADNNNFGLSTIATTEKIFTEINYLGLSTITEKNSSTTTSVDNNNFGPITPTSADNNSFGLFTTATTENNNSVLSTIEISKNDKVELFITASTEKEKFGIFTTASTENNNLGLSTSTEKNSFTTKSVDNNSFRPITSTSSNKNNLGFLTTATTERENLGIFPTASTENYNLGLVTGTEKDSFTTASADNNNFELFTPATTEKENLGIFTTASTENNNLGLSSITEKNISTTTNVDNNNFGPITTTSADNNNFLSITTTSADNNNFGLFLTATTEKEKIGIFSRTSNENNNLGLSKITEKSSFTTTSADNNNFGLLSTNIEKNFGSITSTSSDKNNSLGLFTKATTGKENFGIFTTASTENKNFGLSTPEITKNDNVEIFTKESTDTNNVGLFTTTEKNMFTTTRVDNNFRSPTTESTENNNFGLPTTASTKNNNFELFTTENTESNNVGVFTTESNQKNYFGLFSTKNNKNNDIGLSTTESSNTNNLERFTSAEKNISTTAIANNNDTTESTKNNNLALSTTERIEKNNFGYFTSTEKNIFPTTSAENNNFGFSTTKSTKNNNFVLLTTAGTDNNNIGLFTTINTPTTHELPKKDQFYNEPDGVLILVLISTIPFVILCSITAACWYVRHTREKKRRNSCNSTNLTRGSNTYTSADNKYWTTRVSLYDTSKSPLFQSQTSLKSSQPDYHTVLLMPYDSEPIGRTKTNKNGKTCYPDYSNLLTNNLSIYRGPKRLTTFASKDPVPDYLDQYAHRSPRENTAGNDVIFIPPRDYPR